LGTAFFLAGFEVQDAPRYGAERRGAPIFAYVRADRRVINERGVIRRPDLIIVADETLVLIPAAGVLEGVTPQTVLLISSIDKPDVWQERLNLAGPVLTLPHAAALTDPLELRFIGAACAGAAARLVGVIPRDSLAQAIRAELAPLGEAIMARNSEHTLEAFDLVAEHTSCVTETPETPADNYARPRWIELPFDDASLSAPDIFAPASSARVPTGLWRTMRPVIDYSHCKRCAWICSTLCPDSTISVNADGYPQIDYEHCKGCLICMTSCPSHAIRALPEEAAAAKKTVGRGG
jgi:pyruvate ferredoxin oxidoreductase gamma subunit